MIKASPIATFLVVTSIQLHYVVVETHEKFQPSFGYSAGGQHVLTIGAHAIDVPDVGDTGDIAPLLRT